MRIALGVEYDGSNYQGWQAQRDASTVQFQIESALSRVASHPVRVHCSGRTDAGVHASAQVAHFDTDASRDGHNWLLGANVSLPHDISVVWAKPVPEQFHARFSALRRRYNYLILNRLARPAVLARRAAWVHKSIVAERMNDAARCLIGRHDFSSFRAQGCQAKSPVRTVFRIDVERRGPFVVLTVEADGFLQKMVRNIAGVLIAVGSGRHEPEWVAEVLEHRSRSLGGVTAPPDGLYLSGVYYPPEFEIPRPPEFYAV